MVELSGGRVEAGYSSVDAPRDARSPALKVEILPAARLESVLAAWKGLASASLDDNPFFSPAFLLPMVQHDLTPPDLAAALVWRTLGENRQLVGFLPLRPAVRSGEDRLFSFNAREAHAWSHESQAVSLPLLAADEPIARAALRAILDAVASLRHHPSALAWTAVPADSRFHALLGECSAALGLEVSSADARPLTLGLDFRPADTTAAHAAIDIATDPSTVPALLERILVREAEAGHEPLIEASSAAGFVRAMARGLAAERRLLLALTPEGPEGLGAIVVHSRRRAWLWRLVGPGVGNPLAEAGLIARVERQLGLPVSPVNGRRLTGIGLDIETLYGLRVELRRTSPGFARRLGRRLSRAASPVSPVSRNGSAAA